MLMASLLVVDVHVSLTIMASRWNVCIRYYRFALTDNHCVHLILTLNSQSIHCITYVAKTLCRVAGLFYTSIVTQLNSIKIHVCLCARVCVFRDECTGCWQQLDKSRCHSGKAAHRATHGTAPHTRLHIWVRNITIAIVVTIYMLCTIVSSSCMINIVNDLFSIHYFMLCAIVSSSCTIDNNICS